MCHEHAQIADGPSAPPWSFHCEHAGRLLLLWYDVSQLVALHDPAEPKCVGTCDKRAVTTATVQLVLRYADGNGGEPDPISFFASLAKLPDEVRFCSHCVGNSIAFLAYKLPVYGLASFTPDNLRYAEARCVTRTSWPITDGSNSGNSALPPHPCCPSALASSYQPLNYCAGLQHLRRRGFMQKNSGQVKVW